MTFRHRHAPGLDKFWVVTVVSNPVRYSSRYRLYHQFREAMRKAGVNLLTVELALGDRPFEVTHECDHNHLQLRTWDMLWTKERCLNLGIQRLPDDWEYVAWIDADIDFVRPDWVEETIHQLQHHMVVQMFQNAVDLDATGGVLQVHNGFGWGWETGQPAPKNGQYAKFWHPGFAWAARREAVDYLGGLYDLGILGSGDNHMALSFIGRVDASVPEGLSSGYIRTLHQWQDRALRHLKKDIGFTPGTITHNWHGPKADRRYKDRWKILIEHGYDPDLDIKCDWQGLHTLTDAGERMRHDLRRYFRQRNEDSL